MSLFIRVCMFYCANFSFKPLVVSCLCVFSCVLSQKAFSQTNSNGFPSSLEIQKRNKKAPFVKDTIFYANGNVLSTGKQKTVYKFQGCLGWWPTDFKKGKWVYYSDNGVVERIYRYRKNKIRRQKEFNVN